MQKVVGAQVTQDAELLEAVLNQTVDVCTLALYPIVFVHWRQCIALLNARVLRQV